MRYHHTKNKGDLGLVQAMADLTAKGWAILVPLTEHEAFDLVAYRDGRFLRVQVKYRAAVNGVIEIPETVLGVPAGFALPLERSPFVRHSREPRATWLISAHSSAG
jgi:hypothetical protein